MLGSNLSPSIDEWMIKNTSFAYFLFLYALGDLFLLDFFLKQLLIIIFLSYGKAFKPLLQSAFF